VKETTDEEMDFVAFLGVLQITGNVASAQLPLPPQWTSQDIGNVGVPDSASRDNTGDEEVTWTEAQSTQVGSISIDLPSEALIGVAVTSHQRGTLATGTFETISR
jgi:hypothetical protein